MMKIWTFILITVFFTLPAQGADRVVWVIGNNDYEEAPLKNPVNDADAVASKFSAMGYDVVKTKNATSVEMRKDLYKFAHKARASKIAVVFYAGHAIQVNGKNYLIPTDVIPKTPRDVRHLMDLQSVMKEASQATHLGVVMLDACRDNPFGRSLRTTMGRSVGGRGLARVQNTGVNVYVSYATNSNNIAADGDGNHSPYTTALLANIEKKLDVRRVFGSIRDEVMAKTGHKQQPYSYGSLGGKSYCLTKECMGEENAVNAALTPVAPHRPTPKAAVRPQVSAKRLAQQQQAKQVKIKQESDLKARQHQQKLIAAKNKQIQDRLKHMRKLKLKQLADNKARRDRIAAQKRAKQRQLDKNRKNAWEQEKKLKLRNEMLRRQKG